MSAPVSPATGLTCYHCGDVCKDDSIALGDKIFCCHGCKTVYDLLHQHDLCTYYDLDQAPGISPETSPYAEKFAYLEDEATQQQLLDFNDGQTAKVTFTIPQMHCSSCIWLLENLYRLAEGVSVSRVNFLKKTLLVTFDPRQLTLRALVELLSGIGYEPQIHLADLEKHTQHSRQKELQRKIGVAGFFFANIMLFSLPEYFSGGTLAPAFRQLFSYLNLLFALPVFFYSSWEYFSSALKGFRQKAINIDVPISLGILSLFGRSVYEIVTHTGAGYMDSLAGLVFFLLLGKLFQQKTYDTLSFDRDYKSYFPIAITRKTDDGERTIALSQLEVGDRILVRNQELIPADSVLMSEHALIDYSFVTGESQPVAKQNGDLIYAGGRQVGECIELEVVKEVSQSYLTQLWNNDTFTKTTAPLMSSRVNIISKYFTVVVLLIAGLAASYWYVRGDAGIAVNVFTAVLIIACPCALALSTPFTLGTTLRIFGKHQFYLKGTDVVERLANITMIVFDKTGTLTQSTEANVEFVAEQTALTAEEERWIKAVVRHSAHPLSQQIYSALNATNLPNVHQFEEVPGKGVAGIVGTHPVRLGAATWIGNTAPAEDHQTLATTVYVSIDGKRRGYFKLANVYRPGFAELMSKLRAAYPLALLTGDGDGEKKTLKQFFGNESALHFRQTPQDKLNFIRQMKANHQKVLMIGDGLNDAGALKESDIGISISEDVATFSPACDAILDARQFSHLADFLRFSKTSMRIILASFALSFLYNGIGLSFAVTGHLSPLISAILMPLSSISVILFTTVLTTVMARQTIRHKQ
ncbi:MAG: HAD family hydrolase [Gemmatimonadetes bacterium]|nr:MAG: HAD family hydrolase [Gemmatimonadota bacterium]